MKWILTVLVNVKTFQQAEDQKTGIEILHTSYLSWSLLFSVYLRFQYQ